MAASLDIDRDWTIRVGGHRFGMIDQTLYGGDWQSSNTIIELGPWGRIGSPISAKVGIPLLGFFLLAAVLILAKTPAIIRRLKKPAPPQ
jgi:hypothetical protein